MSNFSRPVASLILVVLVGLTTPGQLQAEAQKVDFEPLKEQIRSEKWKSARKELRRLATASIETGGELDGADLVRLVRYRALVEAGAGKDIAARWWWHAALNLQSAGSDDYLSLIPDGAVEILRAVEVRPLESLEELERGAKRRARKATRGRDRPKNGNSALYQAAHQRFQGAVEIQVAVAPRGNFEGPLLVGVSGVPSICVYAALDQLGEVRLSPKYAATSHPFRDITLRFGRKR